MLTATFRQVAELPRVSARAEKHTSNLAAIPCEQKARGSGRLLIVRFTENAGNGPADSASGADLGGGLGGGGADPPVPSPIHLLWFVRCATIHRSGLSACAAAGHSQITQLPPVGHKVLSLGILKFITPV